MTGDKDNDSFEKCMKRKVHNYNTITSLLQTKRFLILMNQPTNVNNMTVKDTQIYGWKITSCALEGWLDTSLNFNHR